MALTAKANILIVTLVLLTAGLMFAISERTFQQVVVDPCIRRLEQLNDGRDVM